jgi:hypothetical protein
VLTGCCCVSAGDGKGKKGAKDVAGREEKSDIYKLVKMVMERGYDPASVCAALVHWQSIYDE